MVPEVERDTVALARRFAEAGEAERSRVFAMSWWSERVMDWAMAVSYTHLTLPTIYSV